MGAGEPGTKLASLTDPRPKAAGQTMRRRPPATLGAESQAGSGALHRLAMAVSRSEALAQGETETMPRWRHTRAQDASAAKPLEVCLATQELGVR